jgi:hypothetical protein
VEQTKIGTLLWTGVIAVPIGWIIARVVDSVTHALPPVPWVLPALVLVLALLMEIARRSVRGWVEFRRFDERLDALRIARLLVLAKASAVFGAAVAGAYVGLAMYVASEWDTPAGRNRLLMSGLMVVAGIVVAVVAVRCEAACKVPPPDDSE